MLRQVGCVNRRSECPPQEIASEVTKPERAVTGARRSDAASEKSRGASHTDYLYGQQYRTQHTHVVAPPTAFDPKQASKQKNKQRPFQSGMQSGRKGVGESIYSGFTHNPHHLILDSVIETHPKG